MFNSVFQKNLERVVKRRKGDGHAKKDYLECPGESVQ